MSPLAFTSNDPRWATYKQAQERKWQVRKGSRGVTGFFYRRIEVDRGESSGASEGRESGKWFPLLRSFNAQLICKVTALLRVRKTLWSAAESQAPGTLPVGSMPKTFSLRCRPRWHPTTLKSAGADLRQVTEAHRDLHPDPAK